MLASSMGKTTAMLLIIFFAVGAFGGYFYGTNYQQPLKPSETQPAQAAAAGSATAESSATINLVAVDNNGSGIAMPLTVQKRAGYGETLININGLVFWFDTQQSIQTARAAAESFTGADAGKINLVYMIDANASVVEGPSAGAALAIATAAALENKTLNRDVMITGTINPDGTIGQVGGILEKASAAKQAGAKLFLVPRGQGTETLLQPVESCTENGGFVFCRTKYKQAATSISEKAGIQVKEVGTLAEAGKYFFNS